MTDKGKYFFEIGFSGRLKIIYTTEMFSLKECQNVYNFMGENTSQPKIFVGWLGGGESLHSQVEYVFRILQFLTASTMKIY